MPRPTASVSAAWSAGSSSKPTAAAMPPCAMNEFDDWSEPLVTSVVRAPRAAASSEA